MGDARVVQVRQRAQDVEGVGAQELLLESAE